MLAIKLQRVGRKHQPSYRLVVAEARSKMAAPPVEDLGSYHPGTKAVSFKKERISYWLGMGAQPTLTVHNLLVAQGVVSAPKRAVKMRKAEVAPVVEKPAETAPVEATAETESTPTAETTESVTETPAAEEPSA